MYGCLLAAGVDDAAIEHQQQEIENHRGTPEIPGCKGDSGQNDDAEADTGKPLGKGTQSNQQSKQPQILGVQHLKIQTFGVIKQVVSK